MTTEDLRDDMRCIGGLLAKGKASGQRITQCEGQGHVDSPANM